MILYHFTSWASMQDIVSEGVIRPHRGEVGREFPPVVWLTADLGREQVFDGDPSDPAVVLSTAIRFTVDLPENAVLHWRDWLARNDRGVPRQDCAPDVADYKARWHVTERPIPEAEWLNWEWAVTTESFAEALGVVMTP